MNKVISECPSCGEKLNIAVLHCSGCGMELHSNFPLSRFDLLSVEQTEFLISFLKQRGNMSLVQEELGVSYPTARRKLDDLLTTLELASNTSRPKKVRRL